MGDTNLNQSPSSSVTSNTHRILYAIELSVRVLADMGENILVDADSLLHQQFHSFVGTMQETRVSVHIQEAVEIFCIIVLDTPDVEVK